MRFLVSAGPTREPLDDVRFISNPSTGKMGYAVASAAISSGHSVTLVSGPTTLDPPSGVELIDVMTAREMLDAIKGQVQMHDVLVMTAAVADIRPVGKVDGKLKKSDMAASIPVERTRDILKDIQEFKDGRIFIGFAAESGDPVKEARCKCIDKGLDLVVANDLSRPDSGFATDTNKAFFVDNSGLVRDLPLMSKQDLAAEIVSWAEEVALLQA